MINVHKKTTKVEAELIRERVRVRKVKGEVVNYFLSVQRSSIEINITSKLIRNFFMIIY